MDKHTAQKTFVTNSKDSKYFSVPFVNFNLHKQSVLIKNYIIAPELKIIK